MPLSAFQEFAKIYTEAQAEYVAAKKTYEKRKTDLSLERLEQAKINFAPVRDEAIVMAVNNPHEKQGLALLQYMNKKGINPTNPLSDGRLLIDLVISKQAQPTPEGEDPAVWAQQLERIRVYAEQLPKLKQTLERLETSTNAMTSSMNNLAVWSTLQTKEKTIDARHNSAIVQAGQEYLEAKEEAVRATVTTSI